MKKVKDYLLKESDMVVGRKVWHPLIGYGVITNIKTSNTYFIKFEYDEKRDNQDGWYFHSESVQTFYSTNILELELKDTNLHRVVEVRNNEDDEWTLKVLSFVDENKDYPFSTYNHITKVSEIKKGEMTTSDYKFMREIKQPKTISQEKLQFAQMLIDKAQEICNELKKLNETLIND